jgi:hypothetical protein
MFVKLLDFSVAPTQNNTLMTKKTGNLKYQAFSLNNSLPLKADIDTINLIIK